MKNLAEEDKIFCFYCEEIDEEKRTSLITALDNLEVGKPKLEDQNIKKV